MELYRKIRARIAINSSKHPALMTLLGLIFINLIIVFIAAVIVINVDGETYKNYSSTLLTVGKWLIFPASALSVEHDVSIIVAICVAISGMILFTGTVIALTTNYLRSYITQKTDGGGKLPLNNHLVILNYNSQVLAILTDLMQSDESSSIIILSDKSREFIRAELSGELADLKTKQKLNINLIVRKGNPYSSAELSDINISGAKGILIMNDESNVQQEGDTSTSDFDTIKLVLKLSSFNISPNCPIVVEAETFETAEKIREMKKSVSGLKDKNIEAFSYNRKLGQFLALSILYPSMSNVLYHLLSFNGPVFYPVAATATEQYLRQFTGSIPIISFEKTTFVLTEDIKHLKQEREKSFNTTRKVKPVKILPEDKAINLYVLGENKKSPYMLESVKAQSKKINILTFASNRRADFIAALSEINKDGKVNNIAVILSEDTLRPENRDENVILTMIEINRKFSIENRPVKIIAEILEPKNQESIEQFDIENIIISSRIISFFVSKLITGEGVDRLYEEIFMHSISNAESKFTFCIEKAGLLFDFNTKMVFRSFAELVVSVYHGSGKAMMPLGIIRDGNTIYFCTDMDKKRSFALKENDRLIYIAYNNQ